MMPAPRSWSRLGLVLCALYLGVMVLCWAMAGTGDAKGDYVFLQLPIALQMALLHELGFMPMLDALQLNWFTTYALVALPTLLALYWLGVLMSKRRTAGPGV